MKTKKHEISLTAGQAGEVLAPIMEVVLSIGSERAQYWIGKKRKLATEIRKVLIGANPYADLIAEWEGFYRDLFGIEADFSSLRIPEEQDGFDRLIVVNQGMTPQRLYDKCRDLFPCWKYTDKNLDEIVISDRTSDSSYAVWFRDRVEADEELKNISANQLKEQGIPGITLEERFIYELKYFKETEETDKHLDIVNCTLCASSRYSDGHVPRVRWSRRYGELGVDWYESGDSNDGVRSRAAVS